MNRRGDVTEHAVVFGATGRVGAALVDFALTAGHRVTAVARDPSRITRTHARLRVVRGDTLDPASVRIVLSDADAATAVVMAVGADPLRPSTAVTDTVRTLTRAMSDLGPTRYLGITGTAQMPATPFGRLTQAAVRWR